MCSLRQLHEPLGHPCFTRQYHFVWQLNFPLSCEVTKTVHANHVEFRLSWAAFSKPPAQTAVKTVRARDRISVDLVVCFLYFTFSVFLVAISATEARSSSVRRRVASSLTEAFLLARILPATHKETAGENDLTSLFVEKLSRYCTVCFTEYRWVEMLAKAFHALRSTVWLAMNKTPYKRLFRFSRKATNVSALPQRSFDTVLLYFCGDDVLSQGLLNICLFRGPWLSWVYTSQFSCRKRHGSLVF